MTTETRTTATTATAPEVTDVALRVLHALRDRYGEHHDLFSAGELARLRFVRWLYSSGRLAP